MERYIEIRNRVQRFIDDLFNGESIEFGGVMIPVPRWMRRVESRSPVAYPLDARTVELTPEEAARIIAESSWARGWARGMQAAFDPTFETLPPEQQEERIKEWAYKLALRVVRR